MLALSAASFVLMCQTVFCQTTLATPNLAGVEFPVIMRQNIAAGKTPAGTKVQAKLVVATLISGKVIPQDAVLSGEVIDSAAKSGTDPSRLAILMDSAQWKNGSTPIKVYLTAWYYPLEPPTTQAQADDPTGAVHGSVQWGGGTKTDTRPAGPPPFPTTESDKDTTPQAPHSGISKHRMRMKDVESNLSKEDGTVTLSSKRFNIRLDRSTIYVLAAGELGAGPS